MPRVTQKAVERGELSVMHLFITSPFLRGVHQWTDEKMVKKGMPALTWEELQAYVSLELTASLKCTNDLSQYWSTSMFFGNNDFGRVMRRARFKDTRGNVRLYQN